MARLIRFDRPKLGEVYINPALVTHVSQAVDPGTGNGHEQKSVIWFGDKSVTVDIPIGIVAKSLNDILNP